MGMSASQARFLSLTARKTNVEYEGQQINQQRTALSNESANYYSKLTSMSVPTPPSSVDYSKITYSFTNGSETNTVTSLVATRETASTGVYMLNYVQTIPENTMVVNGSTVITRKLKSDASGNPILDEDGNVQVDSYNISNRKLQEIDSETTTVTEDNRESIAERFISAGIPKDVVNNYSNDELTAKLKNEALYKTLAQNKYGADTNWYVIYRQDSSTKAYEPVLYSAEELSASDYDSDGDSLAGIKAYVYGESTTSKEIKNAKAKVEQDTSGRYISLFIYNDYDNDKTSGTTYNLTTKTESDDAAYDDAMNQYYYDKAQYDKEVQEVNAQIEIIQTQDKNLELKLKQLDTEENAISTEMDAVKKVISKNVESSFKTFNA